MIDHFLRERAYTSVEIQVLRCEPFERIPIGRSVRDRIVERNLTVVIPGDGDPWLLHQEIGRFTRPERTRYAVPARRAASVDPMTALRAD
jgi:hypothetical protein